MSLKISKVYKMSMFSSFGSFLFFLVCLWEFIYINLLYVYGIFPFYCMYVYLFVFLLCKMFGAQLLFFNYKVASMLAA